MTDAETALLKDYYAVFSGDAGQRVLANIEENHEDRLMLPEMRTSAAIDPYRLAARAGAHDLAVKIRRTYEKGRDLGNTVTQERATPSLTQEAR